MKHLKYFESMDLGIPDLGITSDEIQECFYEIADDGWLVRVKFDWKLSNSRVDKEKSIFIMDKIPFIEIRILKLLMKIGENYQKLMDSDSYKESLNRLIDRLYDNDLEIKGEMIERISGGGSQIKILIYRKSDNIV